MSIIAILVKLVRCLTVTIFTIISIPLFADERIYDDQPIPNIVRNQFPANSPYRQLSTIGQLRAQQASDFLTFPGGLLANTPRPSLNNFNYGTYAEFQQANNEYIAAARQAQNEMNAIFQGFQANLGIMLAQEGFEFNDIRNHLESANRLRSIVNSLGLHTFYPSIDQAIEFVMNAGRFIGNNVVGNPLADWGGNPSYASSRSGSSL